jgi:hypothetical protein
MPPPLQKDQESVISLDEKKSVEEIKVQIELGIKWLMHIRIKFHYISTSF